MSKTIQELTLKERIDLWFNTAKPNRDVVEYFDTLLTHTQAEFLDNQGIPTSIEQPQGLTAEQLEAYTVWLQGEITFYGIKLQTISQFVLQQALDKLNEIAG